MIISVAFVMRLNRFFFCVATLAGLASLREIFRIFLHPGDAEFTVEMSIPSSDLRKFQPQRTHRSQRSLKSHNFLFMRPLHCGLPRSFSKFAIRNPQFEISLLLAPCSMLHAPLAPCFLAQTYLDTELC